jgi:hypothetical protein
MVFNVNGGAKALLYPVFLFAACVGPSSVARADLLSITTEVLFEEQGTTALSLGSVFGADATSPISFTSFVDPSGTSFSYATVPGSMYLGQSLTITGSGTLNTGNYHVSASINLGGIVLDILGEEQVIPIVDEKSVEIISDKDEMKKGKKTGDTHSDIVETGLGGDNPMSAGKGHRTKADGTEEDGTGWKGKDKWNKKTEEWDWTIFPDVSMANW